MAVIRFYEELNDFLENKQKKTPYEVQTAPGQTVKDLIESQNVPHTEVDLIIINGESVDFSYQVKEYDRISVYPVFESFNIKDVTLLKDRPLRSSRFILDVHLGKLARYLRFSGFDTLYSNNYEDSEIAEIAEEQKRAVITRDRGLLKRTIIKRGYWIRSQVSSEQYREVVTRFQLEGLENLFSRCPECNGLLEKEEKKNIIDKLPEKTAIYHNDFKKCTVCGKIYWKGDHYYNFLEMIGNQDS